MKRSDMACAGIALALGAAALAGCGSSTTAESTPTPTPTPTPPSVVWAGAVCQDFGRVKTSVGALGHNLTFKTSTDSSLIDQASKQLRIQVLAVADAADHLQATLREVPVDFVAANDMVTSLTGPSQQTNTAIKGVTTHLDAAGSAPNVIAAAGEVGQAIAAAGSAFEAGKQLVSAIGDATSQANAQLKEAFDAAPACKTLAASPSAS
ncbi:MAG: hypothetical protein WCP95_02375 [Actinomycetes bacterium]